MPAERTATTVDCDVHPYVNALADVLPYMTASWQEQFAAMGVPMGGRSDHRYPHPTGGALRLDAVPPGGGLPASDPDFLRADHMDKYDVSAAVLIPVQASSVAAWTDRVRAEVFVGALNHYFFERWGEADSRYKVCVTVSPHDPETAAEEIHRYADRAVGVSLPLLSTLMGSKHYYPIYAAAQAVQLPIVIHPTGAEGSFPGTPTLGGGSPRTYAERHLLLPQVAQANLASLAFEGVFDRFPDLRFLFVEWGFSWLPAFLWRMDKEWRNFRASVPWVKRPPSEYIRDIVGFTTQPIDEPDRARDLWELMKLADVEDMLLFSSDYPHYDYDNPFVVRDRYLPPASRDRILRGNAIDLFCGRI